MTNETTNIPVEGEPSQTWEVPVNYEESPKKETEELPFDPLFGLPQDVKEKALAAKIAALDSGKTVKQADKEQSKVVSDYVWDVRIAKARTFFKWSALVLVAYLVYWFATIDWLPEQYRTARAQKERALKVADAQYRVDIATVDLLETKK
jgi:hypothetical protein